jgi:hypothetical protein
MFGNGTMFFANGDSLTGFWNGGFGPKFGKYVFGNGSEFKHYEGDFVNIVKHGNGRLTRKDGVEFKGQFEKGFPHGKISLHLVDDVIIRGNWVRGASPTSGTIVYDNNSSLSAYIGEIKNEQKEGAGKLIWKDGSRYDGQFEKDVMHGIGSLSFPYADLAGEVFLYEGDFFRGHPQGKGIVYWRNGDKCEGFIGNNSCDGMYTNETVHSINGSFSWSFPHSERGK